MTNRSNIMNIKIKKLLVVAILTTIIPAVSLAQVANDTIYAGTEQEIDTNIALVGDDGQIHYKVSLSDKSKEEIQQRVKVMVSDLNANIAQLWYRPTPVDIELYGKKFFDEQQMIIDTATRELFIGNAERYCRDEEADYLVHNDGRYYYNSKSGRKYISDVQNIYYDRDSSCRIKIMETVCHRPVQIFITSISNPRGKPQPVTQYLRTARTSPVYEKVLFEASSFRMGKLEPVAGKEGYYVGTITYVQTFVGIRGDGREYRDRTYRTIRYDVKLIKTQPGWGYWDIKLGDIRAENTERF